MPRKPEHLDGMKFSRLTVVSISEKKTNYNRKLYECKCECGNTVYATAAELKRGDKKECSYCMSISHSKDLTGKTFGRLTVVKRAAPPSSRSKTSTWYWACKCECGKVIIVSTNALTSGNTRSCGCLQVDEVKLLYTHGTSPSKLFESSNPRSSNTSGVTGVYFDRSRSKWCAEIMFQKKKIHLGRYTSFNDAVSARKKAEEKYFGEFLEQLKQETKGLPPIPAGLEGGELIKAARIRKGFTHKTLGILSGYDYKNAASVVEDWENGTDVPREKLKIISEILDIDIRRLI